MISATIMATAALAAIAFAQTPPVLAQNAGAKAGAGAGAAGSGQMHGSGTASGGGQMSGGHAANSVGVSGKAGKSGTTGVQIGSALVERRSADVHRPVSACIPAAERMSSCIAGALTERSFTMMSPRAVSS